MSHNLSHCIVTSDTKVRREAVCGSHQAGGDIVISSYSRLVLVFRDTFLLSIFVTSGVRWKVSTKDSVMWASVTIFPPARSQYTQYPPLLGMKVWPRVPLLGYLARRSPCHSADTAHTALSLPPPSTPCTTSHTHTLLSKGSNVVCLNDHLYVCLANCYLSSLLLSDLFYCYVMYRKTSFFIYIFLFLPLSFVWIYDSIQYNL